MKINIKPAYMPLYCSISHSPPRLPSLCACPVTHGCTLLYMYILNVLVTHKSRCQHRYYTCINCHSSVSTHSCMLQAHLANSTHAAKPVRDTMHPLYTNDMNGQKDANRITKIIRFTEETPSGAVRVQCLAQEHKDYHSVVAIPKTT
jgi:hypothetical protein